MNFRTVYSTKDEYEKELQEEQIYYNFNDGELIAILEINEGLDEDDPDETVVFDLQDGSVEIWSQEDSIFCDEYVGKALVPVDHRIGTLDRIPEEAISDQVE